MHQPLGCFDVLVFPNPAQAVGAGGALCLRGQRLLCRDSRRSLSPAGRRRGDGRQAEDTRISWHTVTRILF